MADARDIEVTVNGESHAANVETRTSLGDFLRHGLDLTGTHMGCEHGVCGACTVMVDGEAVRLQLWDIMGQERFHNMVRVYYQNTRGEAWAWSVLSD